MQPHGSTHPAKRAWDICHLTCDRRATLEAAGLSCGERAPCMHVQSIKHARTDRKRSGGSAHSRRMVRSERMWRSMPPTMPGTPARAPQSRACMHVRARLHASDAGTLHRFCCDLKASDEAIAARRLTGTHAASASTAQDPPGSQLLRTLTCELHSCQTVQHCASRLPAPARRQANPSGLAQRRRRQTCWPPGAAAHRRPSPGTGCGSASATSS